MSNFPGPFQQPFSRGAPLDYSGAGSATVRTFMNAVYAWMCVGLAVTAVVAWYVGHDPQLAVRMFRGGIFRILVLAQLGLVMVIASAVNRINANVATLLFILYAALNGLTLSVIFLAYSLTSISGAFVVTAGMFGVTSVYGMVTKRDLTSLGGYLFMALIGLVLASIVNIFWANSTLYWIVTYAGVLIFVGLTAYDTQRLKAMAYQLESNPAMSARMAIVGSLVLYLDFINLFIYRLRILGDRRR
jgi:FtsH-binding integral membrane protein